MSSAPQPPLSRHPRRAVVRYYSEATADYRAWSPRFNMHFGYWRAGLNPLRLESMLDEMSRQALARLRLPARDVRLADLGCGLGASARLIARERPGTRIHGLTVVGWQTSRAQHLAGLEGVDDSVSFVHCDYAAAPFRDAAYDGAYAIESACHAAGSDKSEFVREAARLLQPGARLFVADGFLKRSDPMPYLFGLCYASVCRNWAVEEFPQLNDFTAALEASGFKDIKVEDASYRIAPSVLHIPFVTARFLLRELFRTRLRLGAVRWGHILACVLSPILGAARSRFGYFFVSASKA